jgi:hypothetical protein
VRSIFFVLGSYESLEGLERKIRSDPFFGHLKTCTGSVLGTVGTLVGGSKIPKTPLRNS